MTNKVEVKVTGSANAKFVSLSLTQNDKHISAQFPPENIGAVVVGLLAAAIDWAQKSGWKPTPSLKAKDQSQLMFVRANGVALSETDIPGVVGMVFAFGAAELNIGLAREALQPVGAALWADSADKTEKPQ
jgi:hypothetical protein